MTARSTRLIGITATATLLAGLIALPPALAAGGRADGPAFYPVGTKAMAARSSGGHLAMRGAAAGHVAARASVKKSKGEQILQVITGIQGAGNNGLAVAAGPKQVVQVGAQAARAYTKSTGKLATSKTTNQFFGLSAVTFTLSQPTVVYDPIGKRFIAAAVTDNSGDIGLVMRISKGTVAAPFGNKKWLKPVTFNSSTSSPSDTTAESMPQIGVSSDKIALTVVTDDLAKPNRVIFFPKSKYYKGKNVGGWAADVNSTYNGQAPAVNASKQPNVFIAIPATADVTVTTYTGDATSNPPAFSKNVVFPTAAKGNLSAPPVVSQSGGDSLDLGGLAFSGVAWRSNKLWAAATVTCGLDACVRVFGINTGSGVTLAADETRKATGLNWFSPALAIDGAGYVHLTATDVGSATGPSQAVFVRTGANKWTSPRFVRKGTANAVGPGPTINWWKSNSAAIDPTSPWDVWVAGASGDSGVPANGLTSRVARVSLAKNAATLKTSASKVAKGKKVTFTTKLTRPGGDVIKGLPVSLQKKPVHGGKWQTLKSGKTSSKGVAQWTLKIKKPALYRTLGKGVKQSGGQGKVFDKVTSKSKKVSLK